MLVVPLSLLETARPPPPPFALPWHSLSPRGAVSDEPCQRGPGLRRSARGVMWARALQAGRAGPQQSSSSTITRGLAVGLDSELSQSVLEPPVKAASPG